MKAYDGTEVDIDDHLTKWIVDADLTLDFKLLQSTGVTASEVGPYEKALRAYIVYRLPIVNAKTLRLDFEAVRHALCLPKVVADLRNADPDLLATTLEQFQHGIRSRNPSAPASRAAASVSEDVARARVAGFRQWYVFCAGARMPGFSGALAASMKLVKLPVNRSGVAVRRLDPDEGPLSSEDADAFESALWEATDEGSPLRFDRVVATLLLFHLGCEPENLARLRPKDFKRTEGSHATLSVPSVKKREPIIRSRSKVRDLTPRLADLVARLLKGREISSDERPDDVLDEGYLFQGAGDHRRRDTTWFSHATDDVSRRLEVPYSDGSGTTIRVTPRRLRYTFARRMVLCGVTPMGLMDLLDHSSLQTVLVYYEPSLELAARLDEALQPQLSKHVDVALGLATAPVRSEPPPTLHHGSAPFACFDCRFFRPRSLGACRSAHRRLSGELEARRRSLAQGGPPLDDTMDAARLERLVKVAAAAISELEERSP